MPVCLPSNASPLAEGVDTRVTGWGAVSAQGGHMTRAKVLQAARVVTVANKECERWHWARGIHVNVHR